MPRSIWNGAISFGLVTIPVTLHAAELTDDVTFHLLDRRNMAPVSQQRVNSVTGEEVPWEEVVKGYEYAQGSYVVVTEDDFRAADVEATQTIDILAAVKAEEISLLYYDKPYYLAPATKSARMAYALLHETLRASGYVGVATIVIRTRQHLAALLPVGDALVLDLLRWEYELRASDDLELPGGDLTELGVTDKELALAGQLVDALVAEWDPSQYHDTYRERLLGLIRQKVETGEVSAPPVAGGSEAPVVVDIMDLLKRSVKQAESRKRA
jgi:DNA end-binding protein Ku